MGKKPNNLGGGGGGSGGKEGGKGGLNPAVIKAQLTKSIREEMDTLRRQGALNALYLNRTLGVGEIKTFEKEWEKFFVSSTPLKTVSNEEKLNRDKVKPELKKVSVEVPPKPRKNNKGK